MIRRRSLAGAGAALSLLLAFTAFRPPATPGPLERDFEAYFAAGVTLDAGGNPYSRAIWTAEQRIPGVDGARDELLPFVGPAASLPFWSLIGRLPYRAALAVWTGILGAAIVVIVGSALRLARAPRSAQRALFAMIMTVASAPAIGALALGQAALPAAAGLAAAIVAYRTRRRVDATVATLVAALQPNLAIPLLARMRSRWDIMIAAGAMAIFAGTALAAGGGIAGLRAYGALLGEHAAAERDIVIQQTPAAIGYALGLAAPAATTLGAVLALLAAALTLAVIVRERLGPTSATLVSCAMLPLAIPFFHEPDFVLELLPLLVLAIRADGRARTLGATAAVLILVDWLGLAQRAGAQGQIIALGGAVACGFAGLGRPDARTWRASTAGLATLALLAVIAVPLALAHPAPTWPDALPAHFHAKGTADASAVWGAEQRAAGLGARDPVWGLLRAIPLTGCVVLALALVAEQRRRRAAWQAPTSGAQPGVAGTPRIPLAARFASDAGGEAR